MEDQNDVDGFFRDYPLPWESLDGYYIFSATADYHVPASDILKYISYLEKKLSDTSMECANLHSEVSVLRYHAEIGKLVLSLPKLKSQWPEEVQYHALEVDVSTGEWQIAFLDDQGGEIDSSMEDPSLLDLFKRYIKDV